MSQMPPTQGNQGLPGATASGSIFPLHCHKCDHVTNFDKRRVCPAGGTLWRNLVEQDGKQLDEMYLKCEKCEEELTVEVDCEGYK